MSMRIFHRRSRPAPFVPSFVLAFAGAFAAFILLPNLWHFAQADVLSPARAASQIGLWLLETAIAGATALAAAALAMRATRERLWVRMSSIPQGGALPGAFAGTLFGLAQTLGLSSMLWSLVLSAIFDLGLRGYVHLGHAWAEAMAWTVSAITGACAGSAAVRLLYFPWLTQPSLEMASVSAIDDATSLDAVAGHAALPARQWMGDVSIVPVRAPLHAPIDRARSTTGG